MFVHRREREDRGQGTVGPRLRPFDEFRAEQYRRVHLDLVARWAGCAEGKAVLKTDLYAEAGDPARAFVWDLVEAGGNVVGIDVSPDIARSARISAGYHAPDMAANLVACDVKRLPFADESFDLVVSDSTLDHFPRKEDILIALSDLSRVLKRGGTLVITLDNGDNLTEPLFRLWIALGLSDFFIGKTYSAKELRGALEKAGLSVTETTAVIHNPRFFTRKAIAVLHGVAPQRFDRWIRSGLAMLDSHEGWRTQYLTAQFIAARAVKPAQPAAEDRQPASHGGPYDAVHGSAGGDCVASGTNSGDRYAGGEDVPCRAAGIGDRLRGLVRASKRSQDRPGWSADVGALFRAAEWERSESERICHDPVSKHFLSALSRILVGSSRPTRGLLLKLVIWNRERGAPGDLGFVVARTRYIDDRLEKHIEDGIEQLVILGAGYDTRAYRFSDLKGRVRVFEVDRPTVQGRKIARVRRLFGSLPDDVVYVGVDLEAKGIEHRMAAGGYRQDLRTLFIWEGVTPCLSAGGVDNTLAFVASNSGESSSVIFDYRFQSFVDGECEGDEARRWRATLERSGLPVRFGIEDGSIGEFLSERGFHRIENVSSEQLRAMYFDGSNGTRRVFPWAAIVTAVVKPRQ